MKKMHEDIIVIVDSDDPGSQIRRLRERAGLSRRDFGFYVRADTATVYRWERNETTPNIRQLQRIAEVVNRNWPKASFASHLIQGGTTVPVVSRLLGHANIATTHRYAAVWEGDRRRAVDTLTLEMVG